MARIAQFSAGQMERMTLHDPIEAKYFVHEVEDRTLLQINTYGRASRDMPGKLSQTLQLDETAARELHAILSKTFGIR